MQRERESKRIISLESEDEKDYGENRVVMTTIRRRIKIKSRRQAITTELNPRERNNLISPG